MATHQLKGALKAIKVKLKAANAAAPRLSSDVIVSGVNIFGYLSEVYNEGELAADTAPVDLVDEEFSTHLKKIQKKDKITKTKGLTDLRTLVARQQDPADLPPSCLAFFLYHFCRVVILESAKSVREAAFGVLLEFVKLDRKQFTGHMKKLFPFWFISLFDPAKGVAAAAQNAFELAFPSQRKKERLFGLVYKQFVDFLKTHLRLSQDALTEDIVGAVSKNEADAIYDRVVGSSLQALAHSFTFFAGSEGWLSTYSQLLVDELEIAPGSHFLAGFLKKSQQSGGGEDYRAPVRAGALACVAAFLKHRPGLVEPGLGPLAKGVWGLVEEKSNWVQRLLWEEVLFGLTKEFQHLVWEHLSIRQDILPRLKPCLKRSAFGAGTYMYQNFIRVVSVLPCFYFDENQVAANLRRSSLDGPPPGLGGKKNKFQLKERTRLLHELMEHLLAGLHNDESVLYASDLLQAYYDSLTFVFVKRVLPGDSFDTTLYNEMQKPLRLLASLPVRELFRNASTLQKSQVNATSKAIAQGLATLLLHFHARGIPQDFAGPMAFELEDLCLQGLRQGDQTRHGFVLRLLKQLLAQVEPDNCFHPFVVRLFDSSLSLMLELLRKGLAIKHDKKQLLHLATILVLAEKLIYRAPASLVANLSLQEPLLALVRLPLLVATAGEDPVRRCVSMLTLLANARLQEAKTDIPLVQDIPAADSLSKLHAKSLLTYSLHPYSAVLASRKKKDKETASSQIVERLAGFLKHLRESPEFQGRLLALLDGLVERDEHSVGYICEALRQIIGFHLDSEHSQLAESTLEKLLEKGLGLIKSKEHPVVGVGLLKAFERVLTEGRGGAVGEAIKEQLFELIVVAERHGVELWQIYWRVVKTAPSSQEYLAKTVELLQTQLANLVAMENHEVHLFDKFISATRNLVSQLETPEEKRGLLIKLVLGNELTFAQLPRNCLPLKVVRQLLLSGGGLGFSVGELIPDPGYAWFVGHLLSARFLPSLLGYDELRRQLLLYCESEVLPFLLGQLMEFAESYWPAFRALLGFFLSRAQELPYVQGLLYLLSNLLTPDPNYFEASPLSPAQI